MDYRHNLEIVSTQIAVELLSYCCKLQPVGETFFIVWGRSGSIPDFENRMFPLCVLLTRIGPSCFLFGWGDLGKWDGQQLTPLVSRADCRLPGAGWAPVILSYIPLSLLFPSILHAPHELHTEPRLLVRHPKS